MMENSAMMSPSVHPAPQWLVESAVCGIWRRAALPHARMLVVLHAAALSPAGEEVEPQAEEAEVERRDRPDQVHDPHFLRAQNFVDRDHQGTGERNRKRYPGQRGSQRMRSGRTRKRKHGHLHPEIFERRPVFAV